MARYPKGSRNNVNNTKIKPDPIVIPDIDMQDDNEDHIDVVVQEPSPQPEKSFKDKVFSFFKAEDTAQPKKRQTRKTPQENLLIKAFPTAVAGLAVYFIQNMIPDPYKACAPSHKEVIDILQPIANIISRRVTVSAKMSADAIDMTNAILSAILATTRGIMTYAIIRSELGTAKPSEHESRSSGQAMPSMSGTNQGESTGFAGYSGLYDGIEQEPTYSNGYASHQTSTDTSGSGENSPMLDLIRADHDGRLRLGLR